MDEPGRWAADPTGRFPQRWWDGSIWTDQVALADGTRAVDPVPVGSAAEPGPAPVSAMPVPPTPSSSGPRYGWATLAVVAVAIVVAAVDTLGQPWIAGDASDPADSFACASQSIDDPTFDADDCEVGTVRVEVSRSEVADLLSLDTDEGGGDSGLWPTTEALVIWGAFVALVGAGGFAVAAAAIGQWASGAAVVAAAAAAWFVSYAVNFATEGDDAGLEFVGLGIWLNLGAWVAVSVTLLVAANRVRNT